jgi:type III secretory pathway lipoprotein EscJ
MPRMSKQAGDDLVEVLGGVRAEMAGQAVELLRRNGISGDVRRRGMPGAVATWAGRLITWDVQVPSRDAERALELLAEGGFPSGRTEAVEVEHEASDTSAADESVKDFLKRDR